jgi:Fe2+ or Zn2+ uptake regulation protein
MSKQREIVLNAVLSSCDHPTAETVLLRSKAEMPSINLATVYRNLNALVKDGLIKKVVADGGDRFDKTLKNHAHFQCRVCGSVSDVMGFDFKALEGLTANGLVESVDVSIKGVCPNCTVTN